MSRRVLGEQRAEVFVPFRFRRGSIPSTRNGGISSLVPHLYLRRFLEIVLRTILLVDTVFVAILPFLYTRKLTVALQNVCKLFLNMQTRTCFSLHDC